MTKKLGFGCMRLPLLDKDDPTSIDMPQFCSMVDMFLERGFTYFDTAYMYHKNQSELAVKSALVQRHPRDSFKLATKLPLSMCKTHAEFMPTFEEQRAKTGVEYFDYYLLHAVSATRSKIIENEDPFGFGLELKANGRIRNFGFSYHDDAEYLDKLLTQYPETDFVQLQLNYLDWDSDSIQARANYEVCVKHNKPVIVMEPVKGGMLANLSPRLAEFLAAVDANASPASWAIRFAASLPNVMMVLSGMSSLEQLDDNTTFMADMKPLNDAERAALDKVAEILTKEVAIACTGCSYCTATCPKQIPIPKYFSLYNQLKNYNNQSGALTYYVSALKSGKTPAKDCISCGACVAQCPQHLQIPELMKQVSEAFDKK